jgi:hypothetical protein
LDENGNAYVANVNGNSVTVYASGANGNAAPIRTIAGEKTKLDLPAAVVLDSSGVVYVANSGPSSSVTVYGANAQGNVAPVRTISGADTQLDRPNGIVVQ